MAKRLTDWVLEFPTPEGWVVVINSACPSLEVARVLLSDRKANAQAFDGERVRNDPANNRRPSQGEQEK